MSDVIVEQRRLKPECQLKIRWNASIEGFVGTLIPTIATNARNIACIEHLLLVAL
jgi:hypothetical protein